MANNYDSLQEQSREHFLTFDQEAMIRHYRLRADENNLYFRLLGREAALDRTTGIITESGERVSFNAACAAYDILSRAEAQPVLAGRWVSITDLGGNTASYHMDKLDQDLKPLEGRCPALRELCRSWGGQEMPQGDVSFVLPLFDFFPVWIQFWEGDEEFPSKFNCLWDANTLDFMLYETTWYARGFLLSSLKGERGR